MEIVPGNDFKPSAISYRSFNHSLLTSVSFFADFRYVIEPGRILLQMDDGADSVQIRDFLIAQPNCLEVSLDSKTYDGAGKKVQSSVPLLSCPDQC